MSRVRRGLTIAAASTGLMFAVAAPAGAQSLPLPTLPSALGQASPVGGVPIVGGFADTVIGIVIGTYYGIVGASSAVLCPILTPVCSTAPPR